MSDVKLKRSSSQREINDLIATIRGIVDENRGTISELHAIKQKNEENASTKKRVDIPSAVSGRRKSEIEIPHKKTWAGEHHGHIMRGTKSSHKEIHDTLYISEEERKRPQWSPDSSKPRATSHERSSDMTRDITQLSQQGKPRSRRDKSRERKRKIEEIRNKEYDNNENEENKPVPLKRETSTVPRVHTETFKPLGSEPIVRSRKRIHRLSDPKSDAESATLNRVHNRSLSGRSDTSTHGHYYEIRKDSTGSVEILPEYIGEDLVENETITSPESSLGDFHRDDQCLARGRRWYASDRYTAKLDNIYSANASDIYSAKANSICTDSSLKRKIVLEKCPNCDGAGTPPEIEIRICSKDSPRYDQGNDFNIIPQHICSLNKTPEPPNRSASLNKIPPNHDTYMRRCISPCSLEVERMTRRLDQLKQEVNNVLKEVEHDSYPYVSARERQDSTRYYRLRYHSAPQNPTGQRHKSTATTDILDPQVYSTSTEEKSSQKDDKSHPSIHLSTHPIELPSDDGLPMELHLQGVEVDDKDVESLASKVTRSYDNEFDGYDPECDIYASRISTMKHYRAPKREEQLLTPPPIPPRSEHDITLRGDNLFDPFHIGTTYVVLSKQNHGRFKFENPLDPNSSAPPSPKTLPRSSSASTPGRTSPVLRKTPSARNRSSSPNCSDGEDIRVDAKASQQRKSPVSVTSPSGRRLYQPRSYDPISGSVISLASITNSRTDLDEYPTKLSASQGSSKPKQGNMNKPDVSVSSAVIRPSRTSGKPMSPEQRRTFNRPQKEQPYREVAVDCGAGTNLVIHKTSTLQETSFLDKYPAARDYHMQRLNPDSGSGNRCATLPNSARKELDLPGAERLTATLPRYYPGRPYSPNSTNILRREMPDIKFLGEDWKEMAQRLGYDNSHIACFARDYPEPGIAFLDHWSKQPDSNLEDLLFHLKDMGSWRTADALDKTLATTHV